MAYQIKSPSGAERIGYTRRDALYAACIIAEKERRFTSRKAAPVAVFEDGKLIADVWADATEDEGMTDQRRIAALRGALSKISDRTSERLNTKAALQQAIDAIGVIAAEALADTH